MDTIVNKRNLAVLLIITLILFVVYLLGKPRELVVPVQTVVPKHITDLAYAKSLGPCQSSTFDNYFRSLVNKPGSEIKNQNGIYTMWYVLRGYLNDIKTYSDVNRKTNLVLWTLSRGGDKVTIDLGNIKGFDLNKKPLSPRTVSKGAVVNVIVKVDCNENIVQNVKADGYSISNKPL